MAADNTLCINAKTIVDTTKEYVEATPSSDPTNWNDDGTGPTADGLRIERYDVGFDGVYRIAQLYTLTTSYVIKDCGKNAKVGHIELPSLQEEGCKNFDFESGGGYCRDHVPPHSVIIESEAGYFPAGDYTLTLEIMVNGLSGERGVYFTNTRPLARGYETETCANLSTNTTDDSIEGTITYYREDGVTIAEPTAGGVCGVDEAARAVKLVTAADDLNMNDDTKQDDFLNIDIPPLTYDQAVIENGDVVTIKVILGTAVTCGSTNDLLNDSGIIEIGTFGCDALDSSLLYPFFPKASGSYYWSAFTITNTSDVDGTVTLYMYEADGDAFKGVKNAPVEAHKTWNSGYLSDLISDNNTVVAWTRTAGEGTMGDSDCYMIACTKFTSDGFAFLANSENGLGESMGYLPRNSNYDHYTKFGSDGIASPVSIIQKVCLTD
ncbi:hypothetical protein QUF76_16980 [Desulfobacterales bacterium HSG16]|nr:hypothetical protein [Desulfobacterales bacterium HSG16]